MDLNIWGAEFVVWSLDLASCGILQEDLQARF